MKKIKIFVILLIIVLSLVVVIKGQANQSSVIIGEQVAHENIIPIPFNATSTPDTHYFLEPASM